MTEILAWMLAGAGLIVTHRAARGVAGGGPAALATAALLAGQLLTFPLAIADAAMFAAAAVAVERGLALHASGRRTALLLLALPAIGPMTAGAGLPSTHAVADVLFCSQHGVATTSAILWCAIAGALCDRRILAGLALVVLTAAGAWRQEFTWHEAVRLFAPALPFMGIGLALLCAQIQIAATRRPAWAAVAFTAPLLLFNVTLLAFAHVGGFRVGEPISFGDVGAAQARLQHDWTGHLFSFPATLMFRATTGLPAGHFDLQGVSHVDATHPIVVDIGGADVGWIGEGWHGAERGDDRTFRWTTGAASVFTPALPAGVVRIRIHLQPATAPSVPGQRMTLQFGGQTTDTIDLPAQEWTWVERDLVLGAGGTRAGRLTLTFDHTLRPSTLGPSGDTRDLGAAIDRVEILVR